MIQTLHILIQGQIQGIGFRPLVSNLAHSLNLTGSIQNIGHGVQIILQGDKKDLFISSLKQNLPPLALIYDIQTSIHSSHPLSSFEILPSLPSDHISIPPIPDLSICQDCTQEILSKNQRRYFYPLINCTNCGPRFSVIKAFPYDRERTSMQAFLMCPECLDQYQDPTHRFFHAQPISCPHCSPKLFWKSQERGDYVLLFEEIAQEIKRGEIVCIQGIGGFHLLCDATNPQSIQAIRKFKDRPHKPLALMCKDIHHAKQYAQISQKEAEILQSKEAPIVLLQAKDEIWGIARDRYGIMLAYTPIHKLLFEFLDVPLVATSANFKQEPIICHPQEARKLTSSLLCHQREIISPIEDSIVQVLSTQDVVVLRHGRGYAPLSFSLKSKISKPLLAMGANQKASFAFAFENLVVFAPYVGDLNHLSIIERYKESIKKMQELYHLQFDEVICDLHPHYESTKLAFEFSPHPIQIQHHYAHTLSVCFEHQIAHEVLSFCFDGTGYGIDGAIWGGEVMLANPHSFERILHFAYFPLLGGEIAIKDIGRNFFALLGDKIPYEQKLSFFIQRGKSPQEVKTLELMRSKRLNSPDTSSVGRIFDAIAWVCGLEFQSYEGESGELIQSLYDEKILESYAFEISQGEIILDIEAIFDDALSRPPSLIASKFLNTLISIITSIASTYPQDVVLCGGVFCNRILSSKVLESLRKQNKKCLIGNKIPPNDNGIAIGQLYYLLQRSHYAR
ncbi:carbamoyltransferase HypF [Helicobacter pametensis]|uniref:carbamoyltransferase HypF n=1 Tax=Helicobacter pametensis TaxID=95149 RepID=UPI0004816848|nr:carbamoyltransferase HypF [Helicobacter pametensis]